jgi:hypothetical protein
VEVEGEEEDCARGMEQRARRAMEMRMRREDECFEGIVEEKEVKEVKEKKEERKEEDGEGDGEDKGACADGIETAKGGKTENEEDEDIVVLEGKDKMDVLFNSLERWK